MTEIDGATDDGNEAGAPGSFANLLKETTSGTPVTRTLLALNALVFLVMALSGVSILSPTIPELIAFGANYGPLTLSGQWYRLLSSTFIHIGIIHLAFNMWCLLNLGLLAERIYGNGTFAAIYFFAGLGGSMVSVWWNPTIVSAGASGAIFGVAGALVAFFFLETHTMFGDVIVHVRKSMLFFVGFNLIFGFTASGIDNGAHLGGLLVGFGMGAILRRPLGPSRPTRALRFIAVCAAVSVALAIGADRASRRGMSEPLVAVTQGHIAESEGDLDGAIEWYQRARQLDPTLAVAHFYLSTVYIQKNMPHEARDSLSNALELDPDNSLFHNELAWLLATTENTEARDPALALTHAERAVELDGGAENPNHLDTLAEAHYANGRFEDAVAIERRALELAPGNDLFEQQLRKFEQARDSEDVPR